MSSPAPIRRIAVAWCAVALAAFAVLAATTGLPHPVMSEVGTAPEAREHAGNRPAPRHVDRHDVEEAVAGVRVRGHAQARAEARHVGHEELSDVDHAGTPMLDQAYVELVEVQQGGGARGHRGRYVGPVA